jgi:putative flippase GtrA
MQFILYSLIGGVAAVFNLLVFLLLFSAGINVSISAPSAFITAAILNYLLCISILFRHKARWKTRTELLIYFLVVGAVVILDLQITKSFLSLGISPAVSKAAATGLALIFNFMGRRFFVFPQPPTGPWRPQQDFSHEK